MYDIEKVEVLQGGGGKTIKVFEEAYFFFQKGLPEFFAFPN